MAPKKNLNQKKDGYDEKEEEQSPQSSTPVVNLLADVPSSSTQPPVIDESLMKVLEMDDDAFNKWLKENSVDDLTAQSDAMMNLMKKMFDRVKSIKKSVNEVGKEKRKAQAEQKKKDIVALKKREGKADRESYIIVRIRVGEVVYEVRVQKKTTVGDLRKQLMVAMGRAMSHSLKFKLTYNDKVITEHTRKTLRAYGVKSGDEMIAEEMANRPKQTTLTITGNQVEAVVDGQVYETTLTSDSSPGPRAPSASSAQKAE
eukprot:Skav200613  [mRNA]  locus=scaffold2873:36716:39978:+ [translate_table: standard]